MNTEQMIADYLARGGTIKRCEVGDGFGASAPLPSAWGRSGGTLASKLAREARAAMERDAELRGIKDEGE